MKPLLVWWTVGFLVFGVWSQIPAVGVVAGFIVWFVAVQVHPWTRCRTCKGKGRFGDPLTVKNWRNCPNCEGKGRFLRTFAMRRD
jgi:hypothetical protein